MRVFFSIAYFVIGIVQFFAVWDGVKFFFGVTSFFGGLLSFFAAAAVTYIPIIGSAIGVYGAINAWDWPLLQSLVLFFWYVPVYILMIGYSVLSERH